MSYTPSVKVIPHQKETRAPKNRRYEVQYFSPTKGWVDSSSHHFAWRARQAARERETFGYFKYRVVDTRG